MALRQEFPECEVSRRVLGSDKPVPLLRPPIPLEFRSGAALDVVTGSISAGGFFALSAAPGSGKTTRVPWHLAAACPGKLVVLIFPYEHMAAFQADAAVRMGRKCVYVSSVEQEYPVAGVAIVSAAVAVAKWAVAGAAQFPEAHILQDESHESGYCTALLRWLGPRADGALSFTMMSATHSFEARPMESGGVCSKVPFKPGEFCDPWDVLETGAPWCVGDITNGILVFEDDAKVAKDLITAYNTAGAKAYRLHSRTSGRKLLETFDVVRKGHLDVSVLIADSTFRSGYDFPVDRVVDTCRIKSYVAIDGKPCAVYRNLFLPEFQQSAGRMGRRAGMRGSYHHVDYVPEARVCDLGPADVDACALMFRVLGYRPPRDLMTSPFYSGRVPIDIVGALRGSLPLGCLVESQLEDVAVKPLAVPRPATMRIPTPVQEPVTLPLRPASVAERTPVAAPAFGEYQQAFDDLQSMISGDEPEVELVEGRYYCARGLCTEAWQSTTFPDGADSVMRALLNDESGVVHRTWNDVNRAVAINACVVAWNLNAVYRQALTSAVSAARGETGNRDRGLVTEWAKGCAEQLSSLASTADALRTCLLTLTRGRCSLSEVEGEFDDQVKEMKDLFLGGFLAIPLISDNSSLQFDAIRNYARSEMEPFQYMRHDRTRKRLEEARPESWSTVGATRKAFLQILGNGRPGSFRPGNEGYNSRALTSSSTSSSSGKSVSGGTRRIRHHGG